MARALLIIPAYNEGATLDRVLASIADARLGVQVVVVNDGSLDDTAEVAARCGATVLSHPFNLGYGAALQTGYKYALEVQAELVVQMDADGQHIPSEFPALMAPVEQGELDLVVGSRFLENTGYQMQTVRKLGREVFKAIARFAGLAVSDPTSGFQVLNRRVLEVYARDFFPTDYPDVDVLLAAYRHGLRVGERPVHMREEERASTMHGGLVRSAYYVYKMLLSVMSTWSMAKDAPRPGAPGSNAAGSNAAKGDGSLGAPGDTGVRKT